MDTTGLIVEATLKGAAALLGAWVVAGLLRRRSASARHLVLALAALGLVALPVLVVAGPEWGVAVLPQAAPDGADPGSPGVAMSIAPAVMPVFDESPVPEAPVLAPDADPAPGIASTPSVETTAETPFPWTRIL